MQDKLEVQKQSPPSPKKPKTLDSAERGSSEAGETPAYNFQGSLGKAVKRSSPDDSDTVAEATRNNCEEKQGSLREP